MSLHPAAGRPPAHTALLPAAQAQLQAPAPPPAYARARVACAGIPARPPARAPQPRRVLPRAAASAGASLRTRRPVHALRRRAPQRITPAPAAFTRSPAAAPAAARPATEPAAPANPIRRMKTAFSPSARKTTARLPPASIRLLIIQHNPSPRKRARCIK